MLTRTQFIRNVVFWLAVYVGVAAALPLGMALVGDVPEGRGFWIEFGVGLGFVGLSLMWLQFVLSARFGQIAGSFGTDSLLQFHRQAGIIAWLFIVGHAGILIAADPRYLSFLDPRPNLPRAVALVTVLLALTAILILSLWRSRLRLPYEWWRISHGLLGMLVLFIGLVHLLQVGYYVNSPFKRAVWVLLTLWAMALLVHVRVVRPFLTRRRPFEVVDVIPEAPRVWTLRLRPVGHAGIQFAPGQFAWLTFGPSPFSLQQHPFSFASSAEHPGDLRFTIKELGDFTRQVSAIPPGTRAWIEGPLGAFTIGPDPSVQAVFIVGGIGITPVMSMLRTLRDRTDSRQLLLIYGNHSVEEIVFREELDSLRADLNLRVVHVLRDPPPNGSFEAGLITPELLERHLPQPDSPVEYFVCGPEPMMDAIESALTGRGVQMHKLRSERFNIV